MKKTGIDISHYQGKPDFAKLSEQVDFVIMQAGYGRYSYQKDSTFERNYEECKKYNIPCSVYWFSYAQTADDAKAEAKACLEVIKGKKFEYPVYFDIEGKSLVGRSGVSAMCKAFCSELEKAGYFAGIYISRSPAQTMLDDECRIRYALWLAEYGSKLNYSGTVGMWQYSSTGKVNGISGNVDMDECYEDYPRIIKEGGFNGYTKASQLKTLDTAGLKYNDKSIAVLALKQLMYIAKAKGWIKSNFKNDYGFGDGTQAAVNELLKRFGYKQNGIAGDNFVKLLGEKLK